MIITMKKNAPKQEIDALMGRLSDRGLHVHSSIGENYNVFGLVGDTSIIDPKQIEANPYVESVVRVAAPYKKANRLFHPEDTIIASAERNRLS